MSFLGRLLVSSDPESQAFQLKLPDLPHGLENARHILDLEDLRRALWALLALLALLVLTWLIRRLRKPARSQGAQKVTQTKKFGKNPPVPAIALRITKLRERHLLTGTFRQGCHELAALLRGFYEDLWHESLTTSTVLEIQRVGEKRIGMEDGGAPGRLFGLLEGLQFSQRDPTVDDLEAVCDLASDVTSIYSDPLKEAKS